MTHPNNHGYVTADKPGKPICIRVFLEADDTQFAVEAVDVWGNFPPAVATTSDYRYVYDECGECGHGSNRSHAVDRSWRLDHTQQLDTGDGIVAFYREVFA